MFKTIIILAIVAIFLLIAWAGWRQVRRGYELPEIDDENN